MPQASIGPTIIVTTPVLLHIFSIRMESTAQNVVLTAQSAQDPTIFAHNAQLAEPTKPIC